MPSTISNFLVGVGFSYDRQGAKEIGSGIDSIKSKALQAGSVLAGAFGVKALSVDFANATDSLGKFGETFGVTANDLMGFGNALAQEGGSLESFLSQLENIERLRAGILVGDAGFISIAGRAGIDTSQLTEAQTATEAYLALADQFQGMTQQQRLNAATALGLDEASIRLLSMGRAEVEATVQRFQTIRPVTDEMTEGARAFNRSWLETKQNVGSVVDVLGNELLPVLTNITSEINSWFDDNRIEALRGAAALFGAAFGVGEAEDISDASGLPEFLFRPIRELPALAFESASGAIDESINRGAPSDSIYDRPREVVTFSNETQSVVPSNTFLPRGGSPTSANGQSSGASTPTTQNINVSLELDGAVIDRKVVSVVDGMAQTVIEDLSSSTRG